MNESMNTVRAVELKRRGLIAIEEKLAAGPVHILKHNRPAAVVLSEAEYQRLIEKKDESGPRRAVQWIKEYVPSGHRSKEDIDHQIFEERGSWEEE
ncbi:toxin-antitoxin protein [Prosthecochloris sp. CIB 2401]|nr:toxin-antitoxin protein [Prosthecochloris sp. CIB 2401]